MKDEYGRNIKMVNDFYKATMVTCSGRFNADNILATVLLAEIYEKAYIMRVEKLPNGFYISYPLIVTYGFHRINSAFNYNYSKEIDYRDNGIPYAASGMIWRQSGRILCTDYPNSEEVAKIVDTDLIQGIDAITYDMYKRNEYPATIQSISDAICAFNPPFKDDTSDADFLKAVRFTQHIFHNTLRTAIAKSISPKSIK